MFINYKKITLPVLTLGLFGASSAYAEINMNLLSAYNGNSGAKTGIGEIIAYSPDQHTVLSTLSGNDGYGVQILELESNGQLTERSSIDFSSAFVNQNSIRSVSSTAIDPLGRGFGVATLIPTLNGQSQGKLAFFNYRSGSSGPITTLDVGFHPDMVRFSKDGSQLFIANEGEFTVGGDSDAPGSISIVDLSGISRVSDVASLSSFQVKTFDFKADNLAAGVNLNHMRINDPTATELYRHIEPEYISELDDKLYVSLQENNAVGVFDLQTEKWTKLHPLGTIKQTIDASDKDGGVHIDDSVSGLPMPDTLATFNSNGKKFIVTANEGDFRVDDGDRIRVKDLDNLDENTRNELNDLYDGNFAAKSALGRLRVSTVDGDLDGDGDIDELIMAGTRSVSIWDAETGERVSDTGSLESLLFSLDPDKHNINANLSKFDKRSDDKGPEPEALYLAEIEGKRIAFIGLERQGGILAFDISNPESPEFSGYINNLTDGLVSPESLLFINAEDSPTGRSILLAGYERNGGGIGVYSIDTASQVVPVPSAMVLMMTALSGFVVMSRQRKDLLSK